jgi:hypothetical protein
MPDPVFLHQLDEIGSRGCGNPFCTHDHRETCALVPRCHPRSGVRVDYAAVRPDLPCGAVLRLRCRRCLGPVLEIAVTARVALTPPCRHGRACDVQYRAGHVTVRCHRCHAVQGTAAVAPSVPEPA